ncbi:twitching motility protein PilJ [Thiohalomonas denitrificans]|uniref:Twitching motility protein PilJ n=1 Tax=Thiohalomonas denitrificans TaxID=415747 RepID=A0A1G5QJB6_9GAMM|nr:twitching motility protein PilJ [Thiohalomonas denitrificans]
MGLKGNDKGSSSAGGKGLAVIIVLLLVFVGLMGAVSWRVGIQDTNDKQYIGLLGEQRVLSQQITKFAGQATQGKPETYSQLKNYRDRFAESLQVLQSGDPETGLPPSPESVSEELERVELLWQRFDNNIQTIDKSGAVVTKLRGIVQDINESSSQMLVLTDEVATLMTEKELPGTQIYLASRQLMLSQRIINNVNRILEGDTGAVTAADRFGRDANLFGGVIRGMLDGDAEMNIDRVEDQEVRSKLEEVGDLFAEFSEQMGAILESSPEMFEVSEAAQVVLNTSEPLLQALTTLENAYLNHIDSRTINSMLGNIFGVVALLLLFALGFKLKREGERRLAHTEAERRATEGHNQRNQQAIMRLLDEMGDLADGDLTVDATVTEDITGAIADSVNYAIEALRTLVTAINDTATQVSQAADQSRATATHLTEASERQAHEIASASSKIREMAVSIEGVSVNADQLAEESQRSVAIAKKGSIAVQNTIDGMGSIREQIQETSKRIKRLGESSQEIGDTVGLINDIAEQTNILALNAAIQAAMAGEAGRGFAVVADEVQRLAERSADATKQIEALVKTIQTDTNEAVISMEQSTSGVVTGAKLAEDAGSALGEIELVSTRLADLIHNITDATKEQAGAAVNITDTMNVIQEITTQTSDGTDQTAASIGNLAELADDLKKSVSGFKLPV